MAKKGFVRYTVEVTPELSDKIDKRKTDLELTAKSYFVMVIEKDLADAAGE